MSFWKALSSSYGPNIVFWAALILAIGMSAVDVWRHEHVSVLLQATSQSPDSVIRNRMKMCFQNGGRNHCYRDAAEAFLGLVSPKEIMASLEAQESYPEIFSRCHEVTHYVGRAVHEQTGSVAQAYEQCTPVCHGGCYHGVIEAYLKDKHISLQGIEDTTVAKEIRSVCGREQDYRAPQTYWECLHGIGHALMFVTDSDLVRSLYLCDALPEQGQREACYGGVFMENSSSSTSIDHPSKYLDPQNPMYPCTALEKKYLNLCYQYQSSYFAELTHWQWKDTIALCNKVPRAYRKGCFHIIGTNQVGYTQDNQRRKHTCDLIANPDFKRSCVSGVASALGGRYVGQPQQMMTFCSLVDAENKKACYRQMGNALFSWGDDAATRRNICNQITDPDGSNWCFAPESGMTESSFR